MFVIAFFGGFLISTDYVYRFTGRILHRAVRFFFLPSEFRAGATALFEEYVVALATLEVTCQVLFVFAMHLRMYGCTVVFSKYTVQHGVFHHFTKLNEFFVES